jgi:sortase (surface protein transpeptidase)
MAFAVVGLLLIFVNPLQELLRSQFHSGAPVADTATSNSATTTGLSRMAPVRIKIPSIKLDTTFVPPLSLTADRTVTVPNSYTEVGWYSGGAAPGEVGPAVILGHIDSKTGPAVFYSLGQVTVGDTVEITRSDGSVALFEITELQRYPQSNFPTLAVYGPTDFAALRLVTCTGTFDRGEQRYSHNLVVYAKLKI